MEWSHIFEFIDNVTWIWWLTSNHNSSHYDGTRCVYTNYLYVQMVAASFGSTTIFRLLFTVAICSMYKHFLQMNNGISVIFQFSCKAILVDVRWVNKFSYLTIYKIRFVRVEQPRIWMAFWCKWMLKWAKRKKSLAEKKHRSETQWPIKSHSLIQIEPIKSKTKTVSITTWCQNKATNALNVTTTASARAVACTQANTVEWRREEKWVVITIIVTNG